MRLAPTLCVALGAAAAIAGLAGCQVSGSLSIPLFDRKPVASDSKLHPRGDGPDPMIASREPGPGDGAPGSTPPGRPVFFGDYPDLESVPFENRLIANFSQHTFTTEGLDFDPDIDTGGRTLLFASTRNSERPDIYYKSIQGTGLTQLTNDPADDVQPRFSPDGERVVFSSNRSGNWDIWMIGLDGTGLVELTRDRSDEISPCWSPDGARVAFALLGRRSHRWEIWTLSLARPGVRQFLAYGMFPSWSPDGSRIAFQRARQRGSRWFSVWTITLVGMEARYPTEVAHSDIAACIAPRWSPDGRSLAYAAVRRGVNSPPGSSDKHESADIWVVDLQSGLRMKMTDGAARYFNPTWGDEGRVYFVSSLSGTENIWSLATDMNAYAIGRAQGTKPASQASSRGPGESGTK